MSGLLEKDIRIVLQRKQALVLFMVMAIVFGYTMDASFIMGYLPFLFMIMAVGTVSYDEIDNGYMFLMTLPITPKMYVKEKYIFCLICGAISWGIAVLLCFVMAPIKGEQVIYGLNDVVVMVSFLLVVAIFASILLPIQLKFGVEKSRVVMCVLAGSITAVVAIIAKVFNSAVQEAIYKLNAANPVLVGIGAVIVTLIILVASYCCSCNIMAKKEY